ncbi:MAG: ATP-grasp domain-containing protein [Geminicoccaceae bacterium]
MQPEIRALILGSDPAKALAVCAALRGAGAGAVLAVASPAMASAATSRLRPGVVRLPDMRDAGSFRDQLARYLSHGEVDVVLPIEDAPLALLASWRGELERLAPWAAPPPGCTAIALDKERTIDAAAALPDTLRPPVTQVPEAAADGVVSWPGPYPAVVKPRTGTAAEGVRFVRDAAELATTYRSVAAHYPRPLVQEFVPYRRGEKYLLFYLFGGQGELRSWYMHRTLVERHTMLRGADGARLPGGINLVWESCLDPDLLRRGQRLLESLGWRGYGFIECVRDQRTGEPRLIEINPRLAGTIALPLQQGVNFAFDACLVALGHDPPARPAYRTGARGKRDAWTLLGSRQPRAVLAALDPRYDPPVSIWRDPEPAFRELLRLVGKRWPAPGRQPAKGL